MYSPGGPGKESRLIRCPLCQSTTVTVVLNSKSHASCARCGATWIQEGSWQRFIRPARPALLDLPDDVIPLPRPAERELPVTPDVQAPTEEAVGT
jgi:Zn-finger nucleic acid-binding protein